jgi:hypothetical protein
MLEETNFEPSKNTRKNILLGIGVLALTPIFKFGFFSGLFKKKNTIACSPSNQKGTMKLLTKDGQLVEVEVSKTIPTNQKLSDKELLEWVNKKKF